MTINTGTGGFPVDDSNTLGTLDTGTDFGDQQKSAGAGAIKWSAGDINVDQENHDLSKGTKKTLADYLSQTTKGKTKSSPSNVGNKYPIESENDPQDISITTKEGYSSDLSVIPSDQPHFADLLPGDSKNPEAQLLQMTVGRQKPDANDVTTGDEILKNAAPVANVPFPPGKGSVNTTKLYDGPVKNYTEAVTKGNKFTVDIPRIDYQYAGQLRTESELETVPHTGYPTVGDIDIPRKKKETLSNFLSGMTRGASNNLHGNNYAIDANTEEVGISDEFGRPQKITRNTNSEQYMSEQEWTTFNVESKNIPDVTQYRASERLLKNVKQENSALGATVAGGQFNPPIPATSSPLPSDSPIAQYYGTGNDSIIENRFSQDRPYSDVEGLEQFSLNYPSGRSLGTDSPDRKYSFGSMSRIASTLSMRAGLEINSTDADFDPNSNSAVAGALLPGAAQLGIRRIARSQLEPSDIFQTLVAKGIDEATLIDPAADSWGHMNNVNDPFTGVSSLGMQLLAAALVIALTLIVAAFTALFSLLQSGVQGRDGSAVDAQGRLPFGASTKPSSGPTSASPIGIAKSILGGSFNVWQLLGFAETRHEMNLSLSTGTLRFFGVDPQAAQGLLGQATAIADAMTDSPGYYAVIARNISRSFLQITDAFKDMTRAFESGIVSGIKQIFELLDVLRNSKFIRALNVFSYMGDRYLDIISADPFETFDTDSIGTSKRFKGTIDRASNNDPTVMKHRLGKWTNGVPATTLAWSTFRSPDLLVMPPGLMEARGATGAEEMGVPSMLPRFPYEPGGTGLKTPVYRPLQASEYRIPTEIRERMEDSLEAEYVPFYFHDVRTNEIISFHAFLASISDSYAAAYDSSEGFGRVEAVKTYKNTARKIGVSFHIAALSPKDFDSMWIKINKLTTLLYPQFTEGRPLFGENYTMHVPFSQAIQAAPLIRLRIGDLMKSNYSKFNLARLFGYSYPGTKFDDEEFGVESTGMTGEELASKTQQITDSFYSAGNYFKSTAPLQRQLLKSTPLVSLGAAKSKTDPTMVLPPGFVLKIVSTNPDDTFDCIVEEASGEDLSEWGNPGKISDVVQAFRQAVYGDSQDVVGKLYEFRKDELIPSASTKKKIASEISRAASNHSYSDKAREFMIDNVAGKGNAIVRSFRSSGGKGIPGFIDSLSFDWYDGVTWEIGEGIASPTPVLGRRAPKSCKVDISFSPVHDIAPGLDHYGANRAPLYPVGPFAINDLRG